VISSPVIEKRRFSEHTSRRSPALEIQNIRPTYRALILEVDIGNYCLFFSLSSWSGLNRVCGDFGSVSHEGITHGVLFPTNQMPTIAVPGVGFVRPFARNVLHLWRHWPIHASLHEGGIMMLFKPASSSFYLATQLRFTKSTTSKTRDNSPYFSNNPPSSPQNKYLPHH